MTVITGEHRKMNLLDEIKLLEKERNSLVIENDKAKGEIRMQREAKSIVVTESYNNKNIISHQYTELKILSSQMKKERQNFHKSSLDNLKTLNELSHKIKKCEKDVQNMTQEKIKWEKLKQRTNELSKKFMNIRNDIIKEDDVLNKKIWEIRAIEDREALLEKRYNDLERDRLDLKILWDVLEDREKKIIRKEKRLDNLKKDLLSKK